MIKLSEEENKIIDHIKVNFYTQDKWSKEDFKDFYYRDVTSLLSIIDKLKRQE